MHRARIVPADPDGNVETRERGIDKAVLRYAEENPDDMLAAADDKTEALIGEL